MKIIIIILISIFTFSFISCNKIDANKGTKLDFFLNYNGYSQIDLKGVGEVYYTNDTVSAIKVVTTQEIFDVLTFKVVSNTLEIGVLDKYTIKNSDAIKIYVSEPMVNSLVLSGSGTIYGDFKSTLYANIVLNAPGSGKIHADNINCSVMNATLSGSGDLTANNLNCSTMNGTVSGSGAIAFSGTATQNNQLLSGSGEFHLYDLNSTFADAHISGSGNIWLKVDSTLKATISGSGNIYYMGYPIVDSNIPGSGNVINAN